MIDVSMVGIHNVFNKCLWLMCYLQRGLKSKSLFCIDPAAYVAGDVSKKEFITIKEVFRNLVTAWRLDWYPGDGIILQPKISSMKKD